MTLDNAHKRLLDNLKTGVILLDADLRIRYLNAAAQHLMELSERKANGLFIGAVFLSTAEDITAMQTALRNDNSFTKRHVELHLPQGKSLIVDYTLNPFEDGGEQLALLELNSLEHSHRISREESLSSAHATTRELVRGLAHEIKNPLGGIRGAAQLLASELPQGDLVDYTNVIIEEADRLRNLVDRLVGSRKPLEKTKTNIHEVMERVANLVEAEITGNTIKLVRDYDPSIPILNVDPEQIIQALLNIVRNAMQSINSAESQLEDAQIILRTRVIRNVTIGTSFHRLGAVIEVIDSGPGIPDEMINTIFYPMISGRAEGTGLGLSITHSIVIQHGGLIEVDSHPERTSFSIILPIEDGLQ